MTGCHETHATYATLTSFPSHQEQSEVAGLRLHPWHTGQAVSSATEAETEADTFLVICHSCTFTRAMLVSNIAGFPIDFQKQEERP